MNKKPIDWEAIKHEYVALGSSYEQLQETHGVKGATLRSRAMRGQWQQMRNARQQTATKAVIAATVAQTVDGLTAINARDIAGAASIHAKALDLLETMEINPVTLKALAGALKDAQAIARLALGVSTNNTQVSAPDGQSMFSQLVIVSGKLEQLEQDHNKPQPEVNATAHLH